MKNMVLKLDVSEGMPAEVEEEMINQAVKRYEAEHPGENVLAVEVNRVLPTFEAPRNQG